jgi:hypothetical protein
VLALVNSVTTTTNTVWNGAKFDVLLNTAVGKQFDSKRGPDNADHAGVAKTQPMLTECREVPGRRTPRSRLMQQPLFEQEMVDGRWYTAAEAGLRSSRRRHREEPRAHERHTGRGYGDSADGHRPATFTVIGYHVKPVEQRRQLLRARADAEGQCSTPDTVNGYFVAMTSADHE